MADGLSGQVGKRSYRARVGITALNLIVPGLGLFRLGRWHLAVPLLLLPFALPALLTVGMGHFPITSYRRAIFALVVVLGLAAALYVASVVFTWRESRFRSPAQGWARWYGLAVIAIVILSLWQLVPPLMHRFYKPFYMPSESMAPTIVAGDKLIADMRWRGPFERGEVVIFQGPDSVRISRIAGIPGDRIAMRDGMPIVNGKAAVQSTQGQASFTGYDGSHLAAVLTERLPGEVSTHRVFKIGPSEFDDMREVVVPPGNLFVLGDNRDRSADSRVPSELAGVGMVQFTAVIGRPMYIHWSSDRTKIGMRLDR